MDLGKNRKGFTLAELLIVVAIIAVLVAIVAPLFLGELNNAKEAVKKANIRAVKSAGIAYIAEHSELLDPILDESSSINCWVVIANVSDTGTLYRTNVYPVDSGNLGVYEAMFSDGIDKPYCEWYDMSSYGEESFYSVAVILFPTELS